MRWIRIREAVIDQRYRQMFEELGVEIVRAYFTQDIGVPVYEDKKNNERWTVGNLREFMKPWLREQYDRTERKDAWLMTMEIAITVLVAAELFMSILDFCYRHSK
jgi:hypothetical protein